MMSRFNLTEKSWQLDKGRSARATRARTSSSPGTTRMALSTRPSATAALPFSNSPMCRTREPSQSTTWGESSSVARTARPPASSPASSPTARSTPRSAVTGSSEPEASRSAASTSSILRFSPMARSSPGARCETTRAPATLATSDSFVSTTTALSTPHSTAMALSARISTCPPTALRAAIAFSVWTSTTPPVASSPSGSPLRRTTATRVTTPPRSTTPMEVSHSRDHSIWAAVPKGPTQSSSTPTAKR